jgi:hypothetical protein
VGSSFEQESEVFLHASLIYISIFLNMKVICERLKPTLYLYTKSCCIFIVDSFTTVNVHNGRTHEMNFNNTFSPLFVGTTFIKIETCKKVLIS